MANLDDIIDRYAERVTKPHIEGAVVKSAIFTQKYLFDDGKNKYLVVYDPLEQIAHHFFTNGEVQNPISTEVTHEQRNYYVDQKVWVPQWQ